jgi:hypothetical protein
MGIKEGKGIIGSRIIPLIVSSKASTDQGTQLRHQMGYWIKGTGDFECGFEYFVVA